MRIGHYIDTAMLKTCRQVYAEGHPLLHSLNTFSTTSVSYTAALSRSLSEEALASIHYLVLIWTHLSIVMISVWPLDVQLIRSRIQILEKSIQQLWHLLRSEDGHGAGGWRRLFGNSMVCWERTRGDNVPAD